MDVSLDLLEHFQLKTNFLDDVTQHSIYQSDRPQGLKSPGIKEMARGPRVGKWGIGHSMARNRRRRFREGCKGYIDNVLFAP